MQFLAAV